MSQTSKHKLMTEEERIQKLFDLEQDHDKHSIDKDAYKKLFSVIWKQKSLLLWGNFLLIITTVAAVYEPRLLGLFIDLGLKPKDMNMVITLTGVFFGLQLIRVICLIAHTYIFSVLGQKVMQELRMKLFTKIQTLPFSTLNKVPAGKLVTRCTNDVSSMSDMFSAGFVTILGNILYTVGIVAWLLVLNLKLGLLSLAVLPVLLYVSIYFSKKLKVAYRSARARLSGVNAFLAENILGMKVILLFNRQEQHLRKFKELNNQYMSAQFGSVKVFSLLQPSITLATGLSMALVIYYGGDLALKNEITLGFLAAYFAYVLSLFQPLREIADKWNIFLAGMASVERIFSILEWTSEQDLHDIENETQPYTDLKGEIEFQNVWFAYDHEKWILKDFNFKAQSGEKIGIVGPTGSGKTTMINLLLRFYEPQKGQILLDGKPLSSYDKRRLRASLGLIQQDVFLFSGSIAENMTLWRRFDPEVRAQLKSLKSFHKLETMGLDDENGLEERGGNLSMGERQILAFARALHTKPRLWIFDEATANMDSQTEEELEHNMADVCSKQTVITIAHRLATVKKADQILVLQHGVLVEKGNHRDLMAQKGLYSKLYEFQELS